MPVKVSRREVAVGLITVLLAVSMGGALYAHFQSIPAWLAAPLVAAFALEAVFYLTAGWEPARRLVEQRLRGPALATAMTLSGVLPYLIYAAPTGLFRWTALFSVAALAALVSFWYVALPRRSATTLAFVALVAGVLLAGLFPSIYGTPGPGLKLGILGELMWTRLAILAVLSMARLEVRGFGFLPTGRDWAAGCANFALFLPVGALLGWMLRFSPFHLRPGAWWQTAASAALTFLGMLWVVALREEFFFRGLLQEWFDSKVGLVAVSVVFGLAHLPFRGFPNWRFAILATVAGLFYGRAYLGGRSVRAAMVAHALVNTVWRVFFS
ncbi:MAG: type II CAAX prenyl endopeptidase Rce1 family protein [Bryobacteraceae bacterium]